MKEYIVNGFIVVASSIFLSLVVSYPLTMLWNQALVPTISTLNEITWLQMWGIGILIGIACRTTVSFERI